MRQVVLDTETTGLEPNQGHRIIELGCVELLNRRPTARRFHHYLHPDRDIEAGAFEVHGITEEDLRGKPRFGDIADDFLRFVEGAELIIHNADFDIGFLDYELSLLPASPQCRVMQDYCNVLDSLALARELHPGQRNSLEALCKRYHVDDSQRALHGALLDAEILAEVYLAMTGGQASLDLAGPPKAAGVARPGHEGAAGNRPALTVLRATPAELNAHRERLQAIEEQSPAGCLWLRLV